MEQRLSLLTLGVSDLARARKFYSDLGWEEGEGSGEDIVFFQAGGIVVGLWDRGELAADSLAEDHGGWGGVTLAYNTRTKEEVDRVIEEASAAGASVRRRPAETFWGGYSGLFTDPDGHPWEVAHNPFWTLDESGNTSLTTG